MGFDSMDLSHIVAPLVSVFMLGVFAAGIGIPVAIWSSWLLDDEPGAIGWIVSRWTPDPWPVGLQEEDAERTWGGRAGAWAAAMRAEAVLEPTIEELPAGPGPGLSIATARIHGSIHADAR